MKFICVVCSELVDSGILKRGVLKCNECFITDTDTYDPMMMLDCYACLKESFCGTLHQGSFRCKECVKHPLHCVWCCLKQHDNCLHEEFDENNCCVEYHEKKYFKKQEDENSSNHCIDCCQGNSYMCKHEELKQCNCCK